MNRKLKIVYFIPSMFSPGGMERVLTDKINYMVENFAYEITIITTEQNSKPYYFPINEKVKKIDFGINFNEHFSTSLFKKFFSHRNKLKAYKKKTEDFLCKNKIDISISLLGKEIEFFTTLKDQSKKIGEIHFAKNIREQFLSARSSSFIWKILGKIRTKQLVNSTKTLDAFVVLTKQDLEKWQDTHNNLHQIYNPKSYINVELSSLENHKAIAVGRLDEQKAFDVLINIWSSVSSSFPTWTLDIYGEGHMKDKLQHMIIDKKLENNIFLKGTTNNLVKVYKNASLYLMTSNYEGFGMVLLEAMSFGIPCIAFDCESGPSEIIKNNISGYTIPLGDKELFSEKIKSILKNKELMKIMGKESVIQSNNFIIEDIMAQWNNLFKSLVK